MVEPLSAIAAGLAADVHERSTPVDDAIGDGERHDRPVGVRRPSETRPSASRWAMFSRRLPPTDSNAPPTNQPPAPSDAEANTSPPTRGDTDAGPPVSSSSGMNPPMVGPTEVNVPPTYRVFPDSATARTAPFVTTDSDERLASVPSQERLRPAASRRRTARRGRRGSN